MSKLSDTLIELLEKIAKHDNADGDDIITPDDKSNINDKMHKSVVNRYNTDFYIAYKDGNILNLGEVLPTEALDELVPSNGKFILLIGKGDYAWNAKLSVQTLDDDISQSEAQDKALSMAESNRNTVQFVCVCQGVNKTYSGRPLYRAFVQYTYVSKKELKDITKIYNSVDEVPDYVAKNKRKQWLEVWNSVYKKTKSEASAFRQANGVVKGDLNFDDEDVTKNKIPGDVQKALDYFIPIKKENFIEGLVYGVVYEPLTRDSHGDWTTAEEIQKWAHNFLPSALASGHWTNKNHDNGDGVLEKHEVEIVECYIAPCDFQFPSGEHVMKGSWVLVSKVNSDELKKDIESGEVTGYSLEGVGQKLDVGLGT